MRLVIDTNILFSALIKKSLTRTILLSPYFEFYTPEYALVEIKKHIELLKRKSGLDQDMISILIDTIMENITVMPADSFGKHIPSARKTLKEIDVDDAPFLALALSIPNDGIWSDDKALQKQDVVKIRTTSELVKVFQKYHG